MATDSLLFKQGFRDILAVSWPVHSVSMCPAYSVNWLIKFTEELNRHECVWRTIFQDEISLRLALGKYNAEPGLLGSDLLRTPDTLKKNKSMNFYIVLLVDDQSGNLFPSPLGNQSSKTLSLSTASPIRASRLFPAGGPSTSCREFVAPSAMKASWSSWAFLNEWCRCFWIVWRSDMLSPDSVDRQRDHGNSTRIYHFREVVVFLCSICDYFAKIMSWNRTSAFGRKWASWGTLCWMHT